MMLANKKELQKIFKIATVYNDTFEVQLLSMN